VLGQNQPMMLFLSFILASFFILEASLVEFVQINSAWIGVLAVLLFFMVALLGFLPGNALEILHKGNWFAWVALGGVVALFIYSSAYVFNGVLSWAKFNAWIATDWFGMLLLLVVAIVVSFVITRK